MGERITDIHMHLVPGVDDGSIDIAMSIEMLKMAETQGVSHILCTSHDWDEEDDCGEYLRNLALLRERMALEDIQITLGTGNEVLCSKQNMDEIMQNLEHGLLFPLNGTHFVLAEFRPSVDVSDMEDCLTRLIEAGWNPVIAHAERYKRVGASDLRRMAQMGCKIQINAYSLTEEKSGMIRGKAQALLKDKLVDFIGSDAHQMHHRPPMYQTGVAYIRENCDAQYADAVLSGNAVGMFFDR